MPDRHVDLAVDLFTVKVDASQHGENVTIGWIHRHQCCIGGVSRAELVNVRTGDVLGQMLEVEVQGGVDVIAPSVQRLCSESRFQFGAYVLHPVGCLTRSLELPRAQCERGRRGLLEFLQRHITFGKHQAQDDRPPVQCGLRIGVGVIQGRCLQQTHQKGGFGQVQLADRFAKIGLRRRTDTVGKVAKVGFVQIDLQDLFFGVAPRDLGGEDRLLDLARVRLLRR